MIKKIFVIVFFGFMIGLPTISIKANEAEITKLLNGINLISTTENILNTDTDAFTLKSNELINRREEMLLIDDKKEWFVAYKSLINDYAEWFDPPETIYEYYNEYLENESELQLLFEVVEAEATSGDFINKCNVASVIFNRLYHEEFGGTLSEILIKSQFSCISDGRYKEVEVTEDTILACEYVWMIGDTTNDCLYFESGSNNIHSFYADFQFEDSIGHRFYKERK